MSPERRRYFRINDSIQLSYQIVKMLDSDGASTEPEFNLIAEQDRRMEVLIAELKHEHPQLIELISLLNQKFERLARLDKSADTSLAYMARDVNISACGLAFTENMPLALGTHLRLFLKLQEKKQLEVEGLLIGCEQHADNRHIWRVDFINLNNKKQEMLIQHLVRRQGAQLAEKLK